MRPGNVGDPQVGRPERVPSGARRGTFLPVPSSACRALSPCGRAGNGLGLDRCSRYTSSPGGGALDPSLHLRPWVFQVVEPPPAFPEFSAAFFLFVTYWRSSCKKHLELTFVFFFLFLLTCASKAVSTHVELANGLFSVELCLPSR